MQRIFAILILMLLALGITAAAQEPATSPTPEMEKGLTVPPIVRTSIRNKTSLELGRVGGELDRQHPLSLREALALALENNKDVEVARHNVKIAEFDLKGARGAYDPKLTSTTYYERIKNPISSFLSGGVNGATTTSDYTANVRLEGQTRAALIDSIFHPFGRSQITSSCHSVLSIALALTLKCSRR